MKPKFYSLLMCAVAWMFLLLLAPDPAHAQDRKVTGKVVAADGPLPGATVLLKGSNVGTSADGAGVFTISVKGANPVLVISAIGYKSQEIVVGNQTAINVQLEDDATALSEVVVTGYQQLRKRDITGAVAVSKCRRT